MLGDAVHELLGSFGVTPERVSRWLGKPCDCEERRAKLNALHAWARRIAAGKVEKAREYLEQILQ